MLVAAAPRAAGHASSRSVAVAIRRTPRGKWAFAAVGMVPVALFQASASLSHDAMTLAVAFVVVSSALRVLDPPDGTSTRARS